MKHVLTSLSILMVAFATSPRSASAQTMAAWLYAYQYWGGTALPAVMGIAPQVGAPGAAVLGHLPPIGAVGEVAVAQGILSVGDQVPLPLYADGISASEGEVFWTSQLWRAEFDGEGIVRYQSGGHIVATFNGRQLVGVEGQTNTGGLAHLAINVQVLVTAVAIRSGTTPAARHTIGRVKARYR
jgi:hypothetical protein